MKKNITIALLAITIAVLLYFLLHEPKQPDNHANEYKQAQADLKYVREQRNAGLKLIDSLERSGRSKDSAIARLSAEKAATQKQADKSASEVKRLAKEVKEITIGDTTEQGRKCDSLAAVAENFAYLYEQYRDYSNILASKLDSQKVDYQLAINEQKRLYNELFAKYEQLNTLYNNLYKDISGLQKTVRRERLKTKIAALLALVAGGAAVFK